MTQQVHSRLPQAPRVKGPSTKWGQFTTDPDLITYFNSPYTKQLIKIIEEAGRVLETNSDYDCPSWAYKQADINGRLAIIKLMKDLLLNE